MAPLVAAAATTVAIADFVAVEVAHVSDIVFRTRCFAAFGIRSLVTMLRVEVVVDVALEVFGAVVPRASADEDAA